VRTFGLLSLIAIGVACQKASGPDARDVVQQFYTTTIAQRMTGAPTPGQLATLAPYVSDTLHALLVAARKRNEADAARAPDEKPAFADGDLFSSLFEGPNAVEVIADSARGSRRVATVRMTYNGARPPITWVDRVILSKQGGRFVVDDVEYAGEWDFANQGSLRATLVTALATAP
jgi:hypothetical protein